MGTLRLVAPLFHQKFSLRFSDAMDSAADCAEGWLAVDAANSSASDVSSFTAQYHHSTTSGDFNLAPPTSQTLSRWASVGRCQRRRAPEPAPCVDDLRAPSPTRRGAQQMVINESSPLPSPGALGRALEAAAQEPPPAVAVHPVSLPTEETLLMS